MTIERVINALVTLTLAEMMASIGLGVGFSDLGAVAKNSRLLIRAALANYVCVPAITVVLLFWFHPPPLGSSSSQYARAPHLRLHLQKWPKATWPSQSD